MWQIVLQTSYSSPPYPKILLTFEYFVEWGIKALILFGLGCTPLTNSTCPKYSTCDSLIVHFVSLKCRLCSYKVLKLIWDVPYEPAAPIYCISRYHQRIQSQTYRYMPLIPNSLNFKRLKSHWWTQMTLVWTRSVPHAF